MPLPGRTTVLKLNERGAMGVRRNASVSGWEMGPPAEREYAVDPVGVDSNRPSAYLSAMYMITVSDLQRLL